MADLPEDRVVRRTPLAAWHSAHGAQFVERHGWQVPRYSRAAAGDGLALADISASAKLALRGRDVAAIVQAFDNARAAEHVGGVATLAADAGVFLCRLTAESLLVLASTPQVQLPAAELELRYTGREWQIRGQPIGLALQDMTSAYAGICLTGEQGGTLLARLSLLDLMPHRLPPGRCVETNLAGVHTLVFRTAAPSPTIRLYLAWDVAEYLWQRLLDAGREFGIEPATGIG